MSLGQQIADSLPFLRRYARALTGSQQHGDQWVAKTLKAALADTDMQAALEQGGRIALYRAFHSVWSEAAQPATAEASGTPEANAQRRLGAVTPTNRQALLLTSLEGFSPSQAGQVMGLESGQIEELVAGAVNEIEKEQKTSVLVIEDEPLISMQLEDLVISLGHSVSGTATTRTEAVAAVEETRPGLVLADIQLADGSSGLDAVDDILAIGTVPIIFITAYPERLLTGDRPEPTYLVTKPFRDESVRAAISQALFFGSPTKAG